MFFLRKSNLERLPIAMSGVRMGERALQIGIDDPVVAGAIAAKVGLSGHAAMVLGDERSAAKARAAAATAGVLIDVWVTPLDSLPFSSDSFDLIVVHAAGGAVPSPDTAASVAMLRDSHRVLRNGGRIIMIEAGARGGLASWLRTQRAGMQPGRAIAALGSAGFKAARLLADREGYRFTEGLKT